MGNYPPKIHSVSNSAKGVVVKGEHFTRHSVVFIDGEIVDTRYVDKETVIALNTSVSPRNAVVIHQYDESKEHTFVKSEIYVVE